MDRKQLNSRSIQLVVRKNPCLKSAMDKLYAAREKTGDIKFIVGGQTIRAHRCVLAAHSPRYEAQFYGAMAEKDSITVEGVSSGAFKEFLQFFYTDEVTLTLENIEDVLNLAKQSLVDELVTECINSLIDLVGLDNIVWCYRLVLDYDIEPLENHCKNHIMTNIKAVFQSADFQSCDQKMLRQILTLPRSNCKEIDAFYGCMSWARARCEQQGMDATNSTNLRMALGEITSEIQFDSMKFEEFAAIDKTFAGFFSAQESNKIFHSIALKANEVANSAQCARSLKCSFAEGSRTRISSSNSSVNKSISFRCDKAIELNGLVSCNRIDHDFSVIVSTGMTKCPESKITHSQDETTITFDHSITISANKLCFIGIYSKKVEKSNSSLFGFHIQDNVAQHGVGFQFSNTNPKILKLITHLLFNIADKS